MVFLRLLHDFHAYESSVVGELTAAAVLSARGMRLENFGPPLGTHSDRLLSNGLFLSIPAHNPVFNPGGLDGKAYYFEFVSITIIRLFLFFGCAGIIS